MARRPLVHTTLLLVPFQIVRAGEALLPVLVARWFGATEGTSAYTLALTTFTFVAGLGFGVFRDSVLVPMLAEVRVREPEQMAAVAGSFLAHTLVYGGALAALVAGAAYVGFHARYPAAEAAAASRLVAPFAAWLVALALKSLFVSVLAAHHRFVAQPLSAGAGVAVTLSTLAALRGAGVSAVPTAMLAGELAATAVLAWMCIALAGLRFPLSLARPEAVRRFVALALPDVIGGAITRVNPVVAQLIAGGTAVVGGGMLLKTAGDVGDFPTSVVQAALLPVLLTHLSDDLAEGNLPRFRATVVRSVAATTAVLGAVAVALHLAREPVLRLVFLGDKMDATSVAHLQAILPYYLLGLPPFGALLVLARAHIALKNTRIMLPMGLFNAGLHAALSLALVRQLGLSGVALATSCVNFAVALAFWILLEARLSRSDVALVAPSPDEAAP